MADFEAMAPGVVGALFSLVSKVLKNLPTVEVKNPPRMADFYRWALAAESALGLPEGAVSEAYRRNQEDAAYVTVEADLVANAIQSMMTNLNKYRKTDWSGTASDLLQYLRTYGYDDKFMPKTPNGLSNKLKRAKDNLEKQGITITMERNSVQRLIKISCNP